MKHTNFYDEVDYEQAPETWLVHALYLAPAIILVVYLLAHLIISL